MKVGRETILVIDDSATIRKLVDTHLSPLGYTVILAPTAESGLKLVAEASPDLILLDHQLPGTTGFEVCRQLVASSATQTIPVVVSSTLRNRAYVEYAELPNVVDMLPKPYSSELLITTVSNALETGSLIVQSQSQGNAVPEVMHEVGEAELQGSLRQFTLREVLDFLNISEKEGLLEVEAGSLRVWFSLARGRIQGVSANQIDQNELLSFLPDTLRELAPVLCLTSKHGACEQVDGLIQLLDRKVLDPRLLGKLLRYQAALLVFRCFTKKLDSFQFDSKRTRSPLIERLPLEVSLLAILVDGAMQCDESLVPKNDDSVYIRRAIHGQNLDRTGLSARHMKLLGVLSEACSLQDLARRTEQELPELRRVLFGMTLADLVEQQSKAQALQVTVLETDAAAANQLRGLLANAKVTGKVVRDRLALQLAMRRVKPDVMLIALHSEEACRLANEVFRANGKQLANTICVGLLPGNDSSLLSRLTFTPQATIPSPFSADQLIELLDSIRIGKANFQPNVLNVVDEIPHETNRRIPQGAV